MDNSNRDLGYYIDSLRRRRPAVMMLVGVLMLISALVAFLVPPSYRSSATILIETQDVPEDFVRSMVTSYANQRIQMISQRVMTRSNLLDLINRYDLYADERDNKTTEKLVEEMRDQIGLKTINADVIDPRTGRPTQATIAFTLSFEAS
ncbi:MAG: lipopolysaccharide biosynthesis protein, partial [Gammaproteobacteria bacterium]|nr:lipopolysaccharide biosynthesis protein [Gemmatimonadota bacterium]NIR84734.1 lipopolysaccharide biosynthesis protein [Gammaproteobacteria bacterium]NIU05775.1 lipopolysaccharide biosynthesis protein [Gammaproteobacteria bacterium]NIV52898.1 lipopolysaccharide biosynthesis protein [Gammaproteobacteria bacterium]NIX87048.1 lipopolysaccharide biosynthesis protein [Gammaproteobacteria bacterium]